MYTMYDAEYVGVYMQTLDGNYELYLVLSKRAVDDSPYYLESWLDHPEAILVPKNVMEFSKIWIRPK